MSGKLKALLSVAILGCALCASLVGCAESDEMKGAKADFNTEVARIEGQVSQIKEMTVEADALIAASEPVIDEAVIPALETAASNAKTVEFKKPSVKSKVEEITAQVSDLKGIDYSGMVTAFGDAIQAVKDGVAKYKLVDAPSEAYVIGCLEKVSDIDGISAVTEDNDPNGKLNKAGGYTAQVYFSSPLVDQSQLYGGGSIIEKGTNCGGSIEVYKTVEDAQKRDQYLAAFDGSILASGSHRVLGTVVVRTSDKLTASQQKALEGAIVGALTELPAA